MRFKSNYAFDINYRSLIMLAILAIMPNFIGMINLPTAYGFKIHLFQYLIFLAAAMYGPFGGLISGGFGSIFTAVSLGNPYILVGNMILGFCTGFLFKKGFNLIIAAMIAYSIQIPWLWTTDVYLIGMSAIVVKNLMIALFFSNLIWSCLARFTYNKIKG